MTGPWILVPDRSPVWEVLLSQIWILAATGPCRPKVHMV